MSAPRAGLRPAGSVSGLQHGARAVFAPLHSDQGAPKRVRESLHHGGRVQRQWDGVHIHRPGGASESSAVGVARPLTTDPMRGSDPIAFSPRTAFMLPLTCACHAVGRFPCMRHPPLPSPNHPHHHCHACVPQPLLPCKRTPTAAAMHACTNRRSYTCVPQPSQLYMQQL